MNKKYNISASILTCDFANLEQEIRKIEEAGIKSLHLDVMDGKFVKNLTFGAGLIKSLRTKTSLYFDAHLMIEEPIRYIDDFAAAGCNAITVHIEACSDTEATIAAIHKHNIHAGLSLNPDTDWQKIHSLIPAVEKILIMTVYPGFAGQRFMTNQLSKIREIGDYVYTLDKKVSISVDGGVNDLTVTLLAPYNVDTIILGSYLFTGESLDQQIAKLYS